MKFYKYHALGNDYIILDSDEVHINLGEREIKAICHRNYGIGSDGILLGTIKKATADFSLRIFNPDGSEAEKSGNGLRIFARYLLDMGLVSVDPFTIHTKGGDVRVQIKEGGKRISVAMGIVSFDSAKIPVTGVSGEVINQKMVVDGIELTYCAATIGNPHCVIIRDEISQEETCRLGSQIEVMSCFPNRTNVQFVKIIDRNNIRIEIWERGAGYTLASGSSSSAAAAVACRLGYCDGNITVHMPGGRLDITIADDYNVLMAGPVTRVAEGYISEEIFTKR
jgi:diaminopimelate epimerase